MAISWSSVSSLVLILGPILLPKAISYYRSVRYAPRQEGLTVRPLPADAFRAVLLLSVAATVFLLRSLPPFAPEDLFQRTSSRLQIPVDVLFNRVASLRPQNALTDRDVSLRAKFVNLESRLLYLQFGPDVLADCPFCTSEDPRSYLYYALPALLAPHLANLVLIAAATAPAFTGPDIARWRTPATITAVLLGGLDAYLLASYDHQANARALRLPDLDPFFRRARALRCLALALLDALAAALAYLSATRRAFARPPAPAERAAAAARVLDAARGRLVALGIVRNAAARDAPLRARASAYWADEVRLVQRAMDEREVVAGVRDALANRIDVRTISRDAEAYATSVLRAVEAIQGGPGAADRPRATDKPSA